MKISRKEFIKKAGLYCGGIYSISVLAGCSASSNQMMEATEQKDGEIAIENKKLKNIGDRLILEIKNYQSNIILIKTAANEYRAMSLTCSHKGCELVVYKNFFECPCHGSEFDVNGIALKGPATDPLVSYRTKLNNNTITILLNEHD